jgi:hypothetical protein
MLNLYLAFCLTAQTDKPLELGIWNLAAREITNTPTNYVGKDFMY